jgi:hypothetical protein
MIAITIDRVRQVLSDYSQEINALIKLREDRLRTEFHGWDFTHSQEDYYTYLLSNLRNIVLAEPAQLEEFWEEFENFIPHEELGLDINEPFRNKVKAALNYQDLRTHFYPGYFRALGIKVCVYCNAQLAVSIERENNTISARFQIDHFYPQSSHPCFGISFFNLYPACGSCNVIKGEQPADFKLYSRDTAPLKSPYRFILNETSKLNFLRSERIEDIQFTFSEPPASDNGNLLQQLFDINGIYNTQKDIAQELILKARSSPKSYKEGLNASLPGLFRSPDILNRLLVGNYTAEIDIHKRPMSKFMMDLARQLGMLD